MAHRCWLRRRAIGPAFELAGGNVSGRAPILLGALWPGKALILVTALTATPADAFGAAQVVTLTLSARQMAAAQIFVWQSLASANTPDTSIEPFAVGPYEGSLYFSAQAEYSGVHTCNTWAAEVLSRAELPIRPTGVVFAGQLWRQLD
jgi:hypothetical protein